MPTATRHDPQDASAENGREFPDGGHAANSCHGREKPESGHEWFNSMAGKRPPGALTWRTSDERKKLLEAWYDEVGVRGSKLEIRLAGILIARLNWSGSTPVKDKELMRRLRCKRAWVQSGLKGLEDMGAIIRDTEMTATRNRMRTLYLSGAIFGGLSSTGLDNGVVYDRTRHKNNDRAPAPARASSRSSVGPRRLESTLAGVMRGFAPAWALGSAGAIARFPVLAGIEALTILGETEDGGANERAVKECAGRWLAAGREMYRATSLTGGDLNDGLMVA